MNDPDQLIGRMVGPFRVIRRINSDDWGAVYEAIQVAVNRPVALKVLNPAFYQDPEKVHQFTAFAASMAMAQNPHLTVVYEAGESDGLIFYAREHLDGSTLQNRVETGNFISEDVALQVVLHIGEALNYEKKSNVRHLPLMMDQVIISSTGVPKLQNNISTEGEIVSDGELDEIRRLGVILREGTGGLAGMTPEFQFMVQRMETAGERGSFNWDSLLQEVRRLDLNRHAMRAAHPISTGKLQAVETPSSKHRWAAWTAGGAAVFIVVALGVWRFFLFERNPGAVDVDSMIKIPGGPFVYQSNEKVSLPAFSIDKYEVTIGQYRKFLEAWKRDKTAVREHPKVNWKKDHTPAQWNLTLERIRDRRPLNGQVIYENTAVFNVDYFDAWAYAQWVGKRLPTEQEWEKAARGPNGNLFPWGSASSSQNANTGADVGHGSSDPNFGKTDGFGVWSPVGAKSKDKSFYGIMDMGGNVSEWTDSWGPHRDFLAEQVPVVRGGNWGSTDIKTTLRDLSHSARQQVRQIGFRCVSGGAFSPSNPPAPSTESNPPLDGAK